MGFSRKAQEGPAADGAGPEARAVQEAELAVRQAATRAEEIEAALQARRWERQCVGDEARALRERLEGMALDDREADRAAVRLRHAEVLGDRLDRDLQDTVTALSEARGALAEAQAALEGARARQRQAQREKRLEALCIEFADRLAAVLSLIDERQRLLAEADEDSGAHGLPRLGRRRFQARRGQVRSSAGEELAAILLPERALGIDYGQSL